MALSRQERRALREIEEQLAVEDPALADVLRRAERTRLERLMQGASRNAVMAVMSVLCLGLVLIGTGVLSGWLLIFTILLSGLCTFGLSLVWVVLGRAR